MTVLKKFEAKVDRDPQPNKLTLEIAEAIKEVKKIQKGEIAPLSLKDI